MNYGKITEKPFKFGGYSEGVWTIKIVRKDYIKPVIFSTPFKNKFFGWIGCLLLVSDMNKRFLLYANGEREDASKEFFSKVGTGKL